MREMRSVAPDVTVCLTDANEIAVMVETEDGARRAVGKITDLDVLVQRLRELELIQMENSMRAWRAGDRNRVTTTTTA